MIKASLALAFNLIPALRRQRQEALSEFEASLIYLVTSKTARATKTLTQNEDEESIIKLVQKSRGDPTINQYNRGIFLTKSEKCTFEQTGSSTNIAGYVHAK